MYSGVDPNSPVGEALLKMQFVARSWGDIRKELEKIEDWQDRGLQELLREAQKVYVRRDEEKQKAKAKIFVAAVQETQKRGTEPEKRSRNVPKTGKFNHGTSTIPTCFYCNKKGHLKRNCKKSRTDESNLETTIV